MVGRGTLIIILGFSLVFALAGRYWERTSNESVDNFVEYYDQTVAHNIAVSAANVAADSIFLNPSAASLSMSGSFSSGTFTISTSPYDKFGVTDMLLTSVGSYGTTKIIRDTVQVLFSPYSFSKYAFFSVNESNVYWITGDTMWGPYHTESKMSISGSPVFYGKVTTKLGTNPKLPSKNASPYFYGGYESGVSISLPNDLSGLQSASQTGKIFSNPGSGSYDVYLTFNADGTVTYKDNTMSQDSTVPLSTLSSNGVIYVSKGNVHVSGVVSGKATVVADGSSGGGYGNVYIDGNITYEHDPTKGPSNDMLGLVANNNVTIAETSPPMQNINIDAAVFARTGSFSYQGYNDTGVGPLGSIYLYGSITNYQRGDVGEFDQSTNTLKSGYQKNYKYDDRFSISSPPYFPTGTGFQIVGWRE
ncbi:MAG: hypothetical protein M1378_11615 [Bacteroidetes bacterium]|nr:hypothetical protein [Bacteroidota bacterium]